MNAGGAVLRSVAWRDESVRVRQPVAVSVPPHDAAQAGYDEGLRRGLADGRLQGFEAGLRQGQADGLARGLTDGRSVAQEELRIARADMLREWEQEKAQLALLAGSLEQAVAAAVAGAEDDLVVLCLEALCRVVGPALVTADGVRAQVARLLLDHDPARAVAVHVFPGDAALLERTAPADTTAGVRWVADGAVAIGGCVVHQSTQAIDARLEVVLDAFKSALLEGRARQLQAAAPQTHEVRE